MSHRFLSVAQVIAMHAELIKTFVGMDGIRNQATLESALSRPQIGYYDGLVQEAAALMESLANNHPFLDGNKRVAFFATDTFLRINGHYIDCDDEEAYAFFMELFDTNSFRFTELEQWLELHVRPAES